MALHHGDGLGAQGRPVPLWDTMTTVILILILLCAEWILRKRFRMV